MAVSLPVKIASVFLGLCSMAGLATCVLCANGCLQFAATRTEPIVLFLTAAIPFGFCAAMMTNIGFNASQYSNRAQKQKFQHRVLQVFTFFPISASVSIFVVACCVVDIVICAKSGLQGLAVISIFFGIAAFVELRVLPTGDKLIESWAREDGW